MSKRNTNMIDGARAARCRRVTFTVAIAIAATIIVVAGIFARKWLFSAGEDFQNTVLADQPKNA